jgi:penicillin-binding protein 1C
VTNGAIYVYDPRNQKVLAYIGNRSENGGGNEIDMIQRRRSVGSLLKPFLYLEALEE